MKTFDDLVFVPYRTYERDRYTPFSWNHDLAVIRFDNEYGAMVRFDGPNEHQQRSVHSWASCGYELTPIKFTGDTYAPDYTVYPFGDVGRQSPEQITEILIQMQS
jgi:hypothetical protein